MKEIARSHRTRCLGLIAVASILLVTTAVGADPPPTDRTYFVASLGLATDRDEAYEIGVGCLRFTATGLCDMDGDCGEWQLDTWGEPGPRQGSGSFSMDLVDEETGLVIQIDGTARIDARGPKSTIAGAARAMEPTSGLEINFGFVGRHVPQGRCARLVEDYLEALGSSQ